MKTSRKLFTASACFTLFAASIAISAADDKAAPVDAAKPMVMKLKTLTLTVPATWKESDVQSSMRLTTLDIPAANSDSGKGELAVFNFSGGGGGLKQNIERWIGQFGAEGRESKVVKGKAGDEEYHLLELSGTYNKSVGPPIMRKTEAVKGYRMLGAIVPVGSEVYYLKMTGPDAAIKAAAKDFRKSFGGSMKSEEVVEL